MYICTYKIYKQKLILFVFVLSIRKPLNQFGCNFVNYSANVHKTLDPIKDTYFFFFLLQCNACMYTNTDIMNANVNLLHLHALTTQPLSMTFYIHVIRGIDKGNVSS